MKDHPILSVLGGVGSILAIAASLGEFLDTGLGQKTSSYFTGDVPQNQPVNAQAGSPPVSIPASTASSSSTAASRMTFQIRGDGSSLLDRKASSLEQQMERLVRQDSAGVSSVVMQLSAYSGSIGNQSVRASITLTAPDNMTACEPEIIRFGTDADLARSLARMTKSRIEQFKGGRAC